VVCRGTAIGQDWLSNLNAALAVGPGGLPVHAGFARVYRSMKDDVAAALRGTNPRSIHVVGHSLGGAIANLFAMQFALEKRANVCLYTFGAPRPGTVPFVKAMGAEIPVGNVKRVYAMADVVPMVPIWPFLHAPANPGGLRVERGGQLLSVSAHFMGNYKPAVFLRDWGAMTADSATIPDLKSVDYWIGRASEAVPWSAPALWALGKAMKAVLAMVERAVGVVLTAGLTLLDGIAQALHAGVVSGGAAVTGAVRKLIEGIFRFLGRAVSAVENLTVAFLRYVLGLLYQSLVAVARRALGRIDA
jgi:pimeloyl-ACP methyl ester carboxylesterase